MKDLDHAQLTAISHHQLPVDQDEVPLTIARGAGAGPVVVIMPSGFGIGEDLAAQMLEISAEASLVIALDPFFRDDAGPAPYDDLARALTRIRHLDHQRARRDLLAAIEWGRRQTADQPVVALGICVGGPYALRAAIDGQVEGVVTWHGTGIEANLERAAEARCPMRLHFGSADPVVPMTAVETVRAAFAAHRDVQVILHQGATHGFSHRSAAQAYDAAAEAAAMASLRELLSVVSRLAPREPRRRDASAASPHGGEAPGSARPGDGPHEGSKR